MRDMNPHAALKSLNLKDFSIASLSADFSQPSNVDNSSFKDCGSILAVIVLSIVRVSDSS